MVVLSILVLFFSVRKHFFIKKHIPQRKFNSQLSFVTKNKTNLSAVLDQTKGFCMTWMLAHTEALKSRGVLSSIKQFQPLLKVMSVKYYNLKQIWRFSVTFHLLIQYLLLNIIRCLIIKLNRRYSVLEVFKTQQS